MNCINHPELPAVAYCRACGKALCQNCQRTAQGTVYCEEHMPVEQTYSATAGPAADSPYTAPPTTPPPPAYPLNLSVSPGLAFILGLIPGVGAIYNGQYAKGLLHVLVLGTLISLGNAGAFEGSAGPLFGLMIAAWFFYMAFEAYHTARRRMLGQSVDEFSSIIPMRGHGRFPVAPVLLIVVGVVFLLNNLNLIHFYDIARYWPVFLIALGAYMLYARLTGSPAAGPEAANEQR